MRLLLRCWPGCGWGPCGARGRSPLLHRSRCWCRYSCLSTPPSELAVVAQKRARNTYGVVWWETGGPQPSLCLRGDLISNQQQSTIGCTPFFSLSYYSMTEVLPSSMAFEQDSRDGGECTHHWAHRLACCQVNKVKYNKRGETYHEARSLYKRKISRDVTCTLLVRLQPLRLVCHCIMVLVGEAATVMMVDDDGER